MIAQRRALHRGVLAAFATAALACACRGADQPVVIAAAMGDGGQAAALAISRDSALGRRPRIVLRETRGSAGIAGLPASVRVAELLAADPAVVGVVGPNSSRDALLAGPLYNAAGLPHIVPTATSRRLRDAGRFTLLLAPDDSMEGAFAARFITRRLAARRVLILYVGDEYGSGLRTSLESALARQGVDVVDRIVLEVGGLCPRADSPNPYEDQVTLALRHGVPDVVFLATRAPEAGCATRTIHARQPRMRYVAGDGVVPAALAANAPREAVDSTYFITFWHADTTNAENRAFTEEFTRRFGRAPHYGDALVFDATRLLADAVHEVGGDRSRIVAWLESLGRDRAAATGLTGPLTFDPAARTGIIVVRQRGGRTEAVAP